MAYGTLLRFDALTLSYGPVEKPAWLRALQQTRGPDSALRPDRVYWKRVTGRYVSDPYTYLQYAREMRSFYAAHRREPFFPFVTKIFLALLSNQDVAVSFASAAFSILTVLATYLLGAYAFNHWVGLGAAFGLAIEYEVISWGVRGWRDDAFTWAVVFFAYSVLRYWRVSSSANGLLLGIAGGLACLIRITSFSFVLPAFALLLFAGRAREQRPRAGAVAGALTMTALVAPFMINCWLAFGDPLYAINVHTDVYREAVGEKPDVRQSAAAYIGHMMARQPWQALDTAVLGLTQYPFQNKWRGFDPWLDSLGRWLSWAALVGLFLFVGSSAGRVLLLVLFCSLVPYVMTWRIIADWRFTQHAYPFFLIAAAYAVVQVASLATPSRLRALRGQRLGARPAIFWSSALICVAAGLWLVTRILPVKIVQEALRTSQDVTIGAGDRDGSFFAEGWSRPVAHGKNVTVRIAEGPHSAVWIPLPRAQDYSVTVRLDPFPPPRGDEPACLPRLRVLLNDTVVSVFDLRWDPGRVGAYDVNLSRTLVHEGWNRLVFISEASTRCTADESRGEPTEDGSRFRLWYVRVRPPASI